MRIYLVRALKLVSFASHLFAKSYPLLNQIFGSMSAKFGQLLATTQKALSILPDFIFVGILKPRNRAAHPFQNASQRKPNCLCGIT